MTDFLGTYHIAQQCARNTLPYLRIAAHFLNGLGMTGHGLKWENIVEWKGLGEQVIISSPFSLSLVRPQLILSVLCFAFYMANI